MENDNDRDCNNINGSNNQSGKIYEDPGSNMSDLYKRDSEKEHEKECVRNLLGLNSSEYDCINDISNDSQGKYI